MANRWSRLWLAGVAAGAAACLLVLLLPVDSPAWVATTRGASIVATGVFLSAVVRMPPGARGVWWGLWLYQLLTVAGDIVYDVQQYHFGEEPFPGPADALYLAAYAAALTALFSLVRSVHRGRDREAWIDAMIMTIAAVSVVGTFIIIPSLTANEDPLGAGTLIGIAYPLLDLLVLSGLIRLLVGGARVNPALLLLAGSFGLYLTADLAYNYIATNGLDDAYPAWLEALFLGGIVLMAAAAAGPGATSIMTPVIDESRRTSRWRILGLSLGVLTAPALLAYVVWTDAGPTERLLTLTSIAVILLVLWRTRILLQRIELQSEELGRQARTDALTGLPNRRTWDYELDRVAAATLGRGEPLIVAMLDLDHFKDYNDEHGHPVADDLLAACAETWRSQLGPTHFLARYGGEEFAALLPGMTRDAAAALLQGLRKATPGDQTVSIGFAERRPGESADSTVARADHALYAAKEAGRDRVVAAAD